MELLLRLPLNPALLHTAQQKGVRIVRGRPFFYTKAEVEKSNLAIHTSLIKESGDAGLNFSLIPLECKYKIQLKNGIPQGRAVSVTIVYRFPFQKGATKVRLEKGWEWMTERPDVDNLTKSVLDVMTEVGFWKDDSQVVNLQTFKIRSTKPGIDIKVSTECALLPFVEVDSLGER